jgi:hypothetical protein
VAVAAHGFVEAQVAPWVHAAQTPLAEHTWSVPQEVPAATNDWSAHTGEPVPHWVTAVAAQGLRDVQEAPWVQATQAWPEVQTWFVPQLAPAGR